MAQDDDTETTRTLVETPGPRAARRRVALRWLTPNDKRTELLGAERMIIGRGSEADLRIDSTAVSRQHTELRWAGSTIVVRDLESRNGTFVNGRRVSHAALHDGDVLRAGDALGVLARVEPDGLEDHGTELVGALFGPDLSEVLATLRQASPGDLPIVIVGETGVGKESAARAVHALSGRAGPFQAVNCAALPLDLAEAELFGYRSGAFTGATLASPGQVRAAHGGTLLLDELGDLPPTIQPKLLRVLQEKQVTPLGEVRPVAVDVRIVVACQVSLEELVASGRLRRDLAARLAGVSVTIPPLRKRRSDIVPLFQHFLRHAASGPVPRVDVKLLECLLLHDWPGNVRELELLTRKLALLHGIEPLLQAEMLPEPLRRTPSSKPPPSTGSVAAGADRDEHELQALNAALLTTDGNLSRAAASIGISRQRAYRLLAGAARQS